jgi:hypothetical protein
MCIADRRQTFYRGAMAAIFYPEKVSAMIMRVRLLKFTAGTESMGIVAKETVDKMFSTFQEELILLFRGQKSGR